MEERSLKPTPAKLKRARKKGERAQSRELASGLIMLGGLGLLWALISLFRQGLLCSFTQTLTTLELEGAFKRAFAPLLAPMLIFLLSVLALSLFAYVFQRGWVWTLKGFSTARQGALCFLILKIALLTGTAFWAWKNFKCDPAVFFTSAAFKLEYILKKIFNILLLLTIGFLLIGLADFFYQKWIFYRRMRMTVSELKEEQKQDEGDRETKQKMRDR